MTEEELRRALDQDKIVRLYPEKPRLPLAKGAAMAAIDEAVHLARTAGFELVGPCEVSNARIIVALETAAQHLVDACGYIQRMGEQA
jgi:hypothetical protein